MLNYYHNIIPCKPQEGKYFKYEFPREFDSNIDGPAEITFYTTQDDTLKKIEGRYFGSSQLSAKHIRLMTDNDLLTFVEAWNCDEDIDLETNRFILRKNNAPIWIGMEVDSPTMVTHVGICPRNDKNGIYAGMEYELFFWNNAWISLGREVASGDNISFDGIPEGAVLWLRNLDEGREERIFTMSDGKQIWW